MDVKELAQILESAGNYYSYDDKLIKDSRVTYKIVNQNIDNYLIDKKAEKCVVFADFDPRDEVCRLSQKVKVYWFCFEDYYSSHNLDDFNGFAYKVSNINDIQNGLIKVNENRFETLCYTDEDKKLQKR